MRSRATDCSRVDASFTQFRRYRSSKRAVRNLLPSSEASIGRRGSVSRRVSRAVCSFSRSLCYYAVPRGTAYPGLGGVAGGFLFVSLLIFVSSFEFDLLEGSIPRPADAFDEAAKVLLVTGLLLVPAGAVARWLSARIGRSARPIA